MPANIQVYNLATREKLQDLKNTSLVDLSTSSVVKVDLYKEDIKQYVREGNNLVLILHSGEKILIEDFFIQFNDQPQSQLVLLDKECGFLWFDYNNGAVYFKDITGLEQIVFGKSTNFWPWILGAVALGGIAAAAGGGGGGKSDPNKTTVTGNEGQGREDGAAVTGTVIATDKDGVKNPNFTIKEQPKNGIASIDKDTGKWVYTPNEDWHGTDTFKVSVTDDKGQVTEFVVTAVVDPEQDAFNDTESTSINKPVTIDVLDNDQFEGDNLVITHVNGTAIAEGGSVSIANGSVKLEGGKLIFTPSADYVGLATFNYTATTDKGIPETATVNIDISADTPSTVTSGDSGQGVEDAGEITGTLVVNDPEGLNTPNFTLKSNPSNGTAAIDATTGAWTYTPNPDWHGEDQFTVVVTDDQGFTTELPIKITVTPEIDAYDNEVTTQEDTPISIDVLANDTFEGSNPIITHINGTTIIEGGSVNVENGVVKLEAGKLLFTPTENYSNDATDPVQFSYTVKTDTGIAETAEVTVLVNPVNDPPVAEDVTASGNEDTTIPVVLDYSDVDGTVESITITILPSNGTLYLDAAGTTPVVAGTAFDAQDTIYFVPNENWNGETTFDYLVTDDEGLASDPATATITITDVNDPPVAEDVVASGDEDTTIPVVLDYSDVDGNLETITITTLPSNGTLYLDAAGTIPVIAGAAIAPQTEVYFVPNANWNGETTFEYLATDDEGLASDPATATITITEVNDAPVGGVDNQTTPEDTPVTGTVPGTDPDGDDLTYVIDEPPTNGTVVVDPDTGEYTYTPNPDYNGPDEFTVTITDPDGETSTSTIIIDVTPVNDPPVAEDVVASGDEDTTIPVVLDYSDVDGTVESITITTLPSNGTLYLDAAGTTPVVAGTAFDAQETIYFVPTENWNGETTFDYVVTDDGGLASDPATATITITDVNDPPVAEDVVASGDEDTTIPVLLDYSDVDGTVESITITTLPSNGTLYLDAAGTTPVVAGTAFDAQDTLYFVPTENWNGETTFDYLVTDDEGLASDPATATITITDVNDPPVAEDVVASGDEDSTILVTLDYSDVDGTVESITITTLPSNGTLYLDAAGTIPVVAGTAIAPQTEVYFVPTENWNGETTFDYVVTDDDGLDSDPATATITVIDVNDAPVAEDVVASGDEDTTIPVLLDYSDVDGTVESITITTLPSNGTLYLDAAGTTPVVAGTAFDAQDTIYFVPTENWNGETTFDYVVTDDDGLDSDSATAEITVIAVNDPPVAITVAVIGREDTTSVVNLSATDVDGTVEWIRITELPFVKEGTLYFDEAGLIPVAANTDIAYGTQLYFKPMPNWNGNSPFKYIAIDDQGLVSLPANAEILVRPINDAPVALPTTATASAGQDYVFKVTDFEINDVDHLSASLSLLIQTIPDPTQGQLMYDTGVDGIFRWQPVEVGDEISYTMINEGQFKFIPAAGVNPSNVQFAFKPSDGLANGLGNQVTMTLTMVETLVTLGQNGSQTINGSGKNDLIVGDATNAGAGNDTVNGLAGNDLIFGDAISTDFLDWNAAGDLVAAGTGLRTSPAGSGFDVISEYFRSKNNMSPTDAEIYTFVRDHEAKFAEALSTTGGNDIINAAGGNDIIFAGGGNDVINAGMGADIIYGGAGSDTLVFKVLDEASRTAGNGVDYWMDFDVNEDKIQFDTEFFSELIDTDNAADFLKLVYNEAARTVTLQVDRDGIQPEFFTHRDLLVLENQGSALDLQTLLDQHVITFV